MTNLKFENTEVFNFKGALRGMRNPKNSWDLSDSAFGFTSHDDILTDMVDKVTDSYTDRENPEWHLKSEYLQENGVNLVGDHVWEYNLIGAKDMKLAQRLIRGGSEHRKFLRQIFVSVDITAPLYW